MNDVTGLHEQVDLLEIQNNQYLARKQKYAGKDSGLAQLARREAENIQRQRERINELKDFKTMMRTLKQSSTMSHKEPVGSSLGVVIDRAALLKQ